jgi:hypothetical protein
MPPYDATRVDFLKSVLSGDKGLLRRQQAVAPEVSQLRTLHLDVLYNKALADERVRFFVPEPEGDWLRRGVGKLYLSTVSTPLAFSM